MSRIWLDPRDGSWWEVLLHERRDPFPRLLIFLSEGGDVLATPYDEPVSLAELDDRRLRHLLDRAREGLLRSAVRLAVSGGNGQGARAGGRPAA